MGFVEEPDTVYPVNIQDISINQQVSTYLKKLKNDIFNPKIFKDENEDIGFLWEIGKFSVDVWFYSDGTYSQSAVFPDGEEFFNCDVDVSQELPLEILKAIAD